MVQKRTSEDMVSDNEGEGRAPKKRLDRQMIGNDSTYSQYKQAREALTAANTLIGLSRQPSHETTPGPSRGLNERSRDGRDAL